MMLLELERDLTSIALFAFFSHHQHFPLSSIFTIAVRLPAAALGLAVFNTLRPVTGATDIRVRRALRLWWWVVDVKLVVEGVMVQLMVGRLMRWGGSRVKFLGPRGGAVVR